MFNWSDSMRALISLAFSKLSSSEKEKSINDFPTIWYSDGAFKETSPEKDLYQYFLSQDNNKELNSSFEFQGCNNPYHAKAKAVSELFKSRYQNIIRLSLKNSSVLYEPGDFIYLNSESISALKGVYLLINSVVVNEDNTVEVEGVTFHPGLLAWNTAEQIELLSRKLVNNEVLPPSNLSFNKLSVNQEYSSGSLQWIAPSDGSAYEYLVQASNVNTPNILFTIGRTRSNYIDFPIFQNQNLNFYVYTINSSGQKSTNPATLLNQNVTPVVLNNVNVFAEPNSILVKRSQIVGSTAPTSSNVIFKTFLGTSELAYSTSDVLPKKSWKIISQNGNLPSNQGTYEIINNNLVINYSQDLKEIFDSTLSITIVVVVNPTNQNQAVTSSECLTFEKSIFISQTLDLSSDRVYSADISLYRYSVADLVNLAVTGGSYDLLNREFLTLPAGWFETPEDALENAALPEDAEYGDLYRIDVNLQTFFPTTIVDDISWQLARYANNTVISRDIPVYYRRGYQGPVPTSQPVGGSFTFPFGPLTVPTDSFNSNIVYYSSIPDGAGDLYQSTARFSRVGNNGVNTNIPIWSFPRRIFQNLMASRTLVAYYRKSINSPLPSVAPLGGSFTFPDGPYALPTDTNPLIIWSETIPEGLGSLYETRAYVENLSNQGLNQNTISWSQPRKIVDSPILSAILTLFKWSVNQPSISSGTSEYNWVTATNTLSAGLISNGWSTEFPKYQGQGSLWVATQTINADSGTTFQTVNWLENTTISVANPNQIPNSKTETITLYRWALSTPSITGSSFYKWIDKTLVDVDGNPVNPPSGWSLNPVTTPSAGFTLYTASVRLLDAFSAETTFVDWSQSVIVVSGFAAEGVQGPPGVDGVQGPAGADGLQGASSRIAYGKSTLAVNNNQSLVTTLGNLSFPPSDSWDFTGVTWGSSVPTLDTNEYAWQANGIYNPNTNQTFWESPFLATFKVGQLSAIATSTGSLNANEITVAENGSIRSGKGFYEDNNSEGFFLGKDQGVTKFEVGNEDGSKSIKWDGENLSINGSEIVVPRVTKTTTELTRYKRLKIEDFFCSDFYDLPGLIVENGSAYVSPGNPFFDRFGGTYLDPVSNIEYYVSICWPLETDSLGFVKSVNVLNNGFVLFGTGAGYRQTLDIGVPWSSSSSSGQWTNSQGSFGVYHPIFIPVIKTQYFEPINNQNGSLIIYLSSTWSRLPKYQEGYTVRRTEPIIVPSVENGFAYVLKNPIESFTLPSQEPVWNTTMQGETIVGSASFITIEYPRLFLQYQLAPDEASLDLIKQIPMVPDLSGLASASITTGFLPANYLSPVTDSFFNLPVLRPPMKPFVSTVTAISYPTLPVLGLTFLQRGTFSTVPVFADDSIGTNRSLEKGSRVFVYWTQYTSGEAFDINNITATWVQFDGTDWGPQGFNRFLQYIYATDVNGNNQSQGPYSENAYPIVPIGENLDIDALTIEIDYDVDVVGLQGIIRVTNKVGANNAAYWKGLYTFVIYFTPEKPSVYFAGWNPKEISEYIRDNLVLINGTTLDSDAISVFGIRSGLLTKGFYSIGINYTIPNSVNTVNIKENKISGTRDRVGSYLNSTITEISILTTGFKE
jgi:hypothetical protein